MSRLPAGVLREAQIDTSAIADNVRQLRRLIGVEVIAVVKADGYGHGALRAARAALEGGASRLGVADIAEGVALRRAGITAPILAWLHAPGASFVEAAALGITLGVSSMAQLLAAAEAASADRPTIVHLKLETGLGRNGVAPDDWKTVLAEAARFERLGKIVVEGLFSHLSNTSPEMTSRRLPSSRRASRPRSRSGSPPRCCTSPRPRPRFRCRRRGSTACGWGSGSMGFRRSMIADPKRSGSGPR